MTIAAEETNQTIARLTPLTGVLAALDALAKPVAPQERSVDAAIGCILAADAGAAAVPARASALTDGWAVKAEEIADAGNYAPVMLAKPPVRIETGDEMPAGTDAVAPLDTITIKNGVAEATGTVTAGEGVLAGGGDSGVQSLRKAGERLRLVDAAVLAAAGVIKVSVRAPRIRIVAAREDLRLQPALKLIAADCAAQGGAPIIANGCGIDDALRGKDADAVIIVGGTGAGARDRSVFILAKAGRVTHHGFGIAPGETAALGEADGRPVLAVPGRLDAALAVWLVVGRALLAKLTGASEPELTAACTLTRKVSSSLGLAEFVPVHRVGDSATPLAGKALPLSALARANGWFLVPADSEGYAAGSEVAVKDWPT